MSEVRAPHPVRHARPRGEKMALVVAEPQTPTQFLQGGQRVQVALDFKTIAGAAIIIAHSRFETCHEKHSTT